MGTALALLCPPRTCPRGWRGDLPYNVPLHDRPWTLAPLRRGLLLPAPCPQKIDAISHRYAAARLPESRALLHLTILKPRLARGFFLPETWPVSAP